jgi:FkbM family methyltransferase
MLQREAENPLQFLTYNPRLVSFARRLHVAAPLKSLEYWLRGPSGGVIHHKIAGLEVAFAAPDATEFRTLESCYSDETDFIEVLAKKLRFGGVFHDVGSNVGQFLIPVAKLVGEHGEVVGFEPHPANHERLLKNIALNRLTNVRVFQLALADCAGDTRMYGTRGTATVVARAAATHPSSRVSIVRAVCGDDLRAEERLPIPNAVKIDVEGAEFGVLSGLRQTLASPLCELLCLEIHPRFIPREVSTEMVLSLVRSFGFNRIDTRFRGTEIHLVAEKEKVGA